MDIAIAGAGPAGLAAALFLSRDGHRVTIYERFDAPAPVGSGLIVQPTGQAVLAALGLDRALELLTTPIRRLRGVDAATGRTVLDISYDDVAPGRPGRGTHRAALFSVLHDAVVAAGIPIETGFVASGLEADGGGARITSSAGRRTPRFDLVVDASGAQSRLRSFAGGGAVRPLPWGALWTTVDWRDGVAAADALEQRYRRASVMIGVLPLGRSQPDGPRRAALFWSLKAAEAEAVKAAGLAAFKDRVLSHWPQTAPLLEQIGDFSAFALARYGHHTLAPPVGQRLAVIGDAAHTTSPQLGQGANMALLDAAALASALRGGGELAAALQRYAALRRRHVRFFQLASLLLTPLYQSDSVLLALLRDRLVGLSRLLAPTRRLTAGLAAGTVIDPFAGFSLAKAPLAQGDGVA